MFAFNGIMEQFRYNSSSKCESFTSFRCLDLRESMVWKNSCTVGLSESNSFRSIEFVRDHKHITLLDVFADFLNIMNLHLDL